MADQDQPMPRPNSAVWLGISFGGMLFLAGFIVWAAVFGFGGAHSPGEQQASRAPAAQTTGQGAATQPAQQQPK